MNIVETIEEVIALAANKGDAGSIILKLGRVKIAVQKLETERAAEIEAHQQREEVTRKTIDFQRKLLEQNIQFYSQELAVMRGPCLQPEKREKNGAAQAHKPAHLPN